MLTLSSLILLRLYTLPYWSNPHFKFFDRVLEYKQIKNDELDQYDAEPFEQQQFGTAGVEGVRDIGSRLSMFVLSLLSDTPEVNMWLNTDISLL